MLNVDLLATNNSKVLIHFQENYANYVRTLGKNSNKRFPLSFSPLLLKQVMQVLMITSPVNLFYAAPPV